MVLQDCVRLGNDSFLLFDHFYFILIYFFSLASENIQVEYTRELISSGSLLQLSLHKYSNFVIQEALKVFPLHLKSQLINVLQPHKKVLQKSSYGATIIPYLS